MFTPQSFAGSKQKHRWKGVAIGLGAAGYNNSSCYYPASSRPYR
ncbi:hypothetical protein QUF76_00125 [Desulfobacterales bacterium HSG16]|nr:hypothetical protein [Desulfobacterales bacterium HSG16]